MKHYLNVVGILVFILATIGYIVPTAVSAKDTLVVIGGLGFAVVAAPAIVWYWIRKAFLKNVLKQD